jgi:hypothetical protein
MIIYEKYVKSVKYFIEHGDAFVTAHSLASSDLELDKKVSKEYFLKFQKEFVITHCGRV